MLANAPILRLPLPICAPALDGWPGRFGLARPEGEWGAGLKRAREERIYSSPKRRVAAVCKLVCWPAWGFPKAWSLGSFSSIRLA